MSAGVIVDVSKEVNAMNAMTGHRQGEVDPLELRKALACFPTGVAIVTTLGRDGAPVGLTISSFNSVSMAPPLVLWSLALSAGSLPDFRAHRGFAINILSAEQGDLCKIFSAPVAERFDGLNWERGFAGVPVICDCAATLECSTYRTYEGGDHEIILGEVRAHRHSDHAPLVYGKGKLASFSATGAA